MLPACPTCGEPDPLGVGCRVCVEWPAGFEWARSAVRLDSPVRQLVHRFKYDGWHRLADAFAGAMVPLLREVPAAVLVPIPLGHRRRRARGYNQAEMLARALGRLTARPVASNRLTRGLETGSQTRLGPEARRANLTGAFQARPDPRPVILVDDVFTTGATLVSAAAVLLEAGASQVGAVTFARASAPLAGAAAVLDSAIHPSFREAF